MGCGCKIAEGSPVGAWVDHSDCRIADLTASLAEVESSNKALFDDLQANERRRDELIAQLAEVTKAQEPHEYVGMGHCLQCAEDYADCENWCECGLPRTVCDGEHDDDPAKDLDY